MKFYKSISILSVLIIIMALAVSIAGILPGREFLVQGERGVVSFRGEEFELYGRGLYARETVSYAVQAKAQDWVTIIIGVPLLGAGLFLSGKGSFRGKLLLTGTLGYFLYTYISYSFLISYNSFFLIYTALFAFALWGFILSYIGLYEGDIRDRFSPAFPRRALGIFFIVTGLFVALLWFGRIVPSLDGKTVPVGLEIYTTLVIQAMDLALIVPAALVSGISLLRNKSPGYGLAAVITVKGITMFSAVSTMAFFQLAAGVELNPVELLMFPALTLINLLFAFLLFRNVRS